MMRRQGCKIGHGCYANCNGTVKFPGHVSDPAHRPFDSQSDYRYGLPREISPNPRKFRRVSRWTRRISQQGGPSPQLKFAARLRRPLLAGSLVPRSGMRTLPVPPQTGASDTLAAGNLDAGLNHLQVIDMTLAATSRAGLISAGHQRLDGDGPALRRVEKSGYWLYLRDRDERYAPRQKSLPLPAQARHRP
jgi:hypothetical protein